MTSAQSIQSEYYTETASLYDTWHLDPELKTGHQFSLTILCSIIELYGVQSILDVGAGTGNTLRFIQAKFPNIHIAAIEPVAALREQAYGKGISKEVLTAGNGCNLKFKDKEFDLVCEFGVLHHVEKPNRMVSEMLRCSKKIVFISDVNTIGQGSARNRFLKRMIKKMGLWKLVIWMKTKGKMYQISEGDGLFYSYTVFDDLKQIQNRCKDVHIFNTKGKVKDLYKEAENMAIIGVKNHNN